MFCLERLYHIEFLGLKLFSQRHGLSFYDHEHRNAAMLLLHL